MRSLTFFFAFISRPHMKDQVRKIIIKICTHFYIYAIMIVNITHSIFSLSHAHDQISIFSYFLNLFPCTRPSRYIYKRQAGRQAPQRKRWRRDMWIWTLNSFHLITILNAKIYFANNFLCSSFSFKMWESHGSVASSSSFSS